MKLFSFWMFPLMLQGLAMVVDEFYFHRKRGLPLWERLGHPLDTLSVILCFVFALVFPATEQNILIYVGLSVFSCVLVTKDEFVHQKYCSWGENWLHAVLFILHPIVFIVVGVIWYDHTNEIQPNAELWTGLQIQFGLTLACLVYQITYWSFISKPFQALK